MSKFLILLSGPEKGRNIPLPEDATFVVGRGVASDTRIEDFQMSRVHCRLEITKDRVELVDAMGSNGTIYRGQMISRCELRSGDVFQVGQTLIRFDGGGENEESTMHGPIADVRQAAPPRSKLAADLTGKTMGGFQLESVIAVGNTGMLFQAIDVIRQRPAAVKVLFPEQVSTEERRDRFVRAMQTMLPIRHPNIVQLYNAGKTGPFCWAAMEYIDGESLTQVIQRIGVRGMLDWREAWRVAVNIAMALDMAHQHHIVHRNLSPTNLLRRASDQVCLLGDLMLAKATEGLQSRQITRHGELVGDVAYMSPERTRADDDIDSRSDIYGLGATLYALLTGKPPFASKSLVELVQMVRKAEPLPPRQYQLSINELFQDLVLRMIAKHPDDRPETPLHLLRELDRIGRYAGLVAPE
jgi:serine/threonine protein kinase